MLTIRLQRVGKKKFATYRVVIAEKSRDTYGNNLEILGNYNPHKREKGLVLKEDRIKHWLAKGAQMSDTINNLFIKAGLITGKKSKVIAISKKKAAKLNKEKAAAAETKAAVEVKKKADEEAKAKQAAEQTAAPAVEAQTDKGNG